MPGLVPDIYVLDRTKNVDGRDKPGHDGPLQGPLATASARTAIAAHATISPAASRNGAPGSCHGALAPMKYENVSVNRNGPTSCDTLCTLAVPPCNWPS